MGGPYPRRVARTLSLMDSLYVDPASILSVRRVNGKGILIGHDVQGVARTLKDIDPRFRLRVDLDHRQEPLGWTVELHIPQADGSVEEQFVCAYRELDHRIIADARRYTSDQYDIAAELEAEDDKRDREMDHKRREMSGDVGERLAHAIRSDLNEKRNL